MPKYSIFYEREAQADLTYLGRRAEVLVKEAVRRYLADAPVPELGKEGQRKAMAPNPLDVAYRLHVGEYRAYYDVDEAAAEVTVVRVGHKPRETVYLRGQPTALRD